MINYKEILLNILGITRETRHISIGVKQVIYHFNIAKREFTMSKLESTLN